MSSADNDTSGRVSVDLGEPMEQTPLLNMAVERAFQSRRLKTIASITILGLVLIAGAFIGIYLLVVQSQSENVLPPVLSTVEAKGEITLFDSNHYFTQNELRPKYIVIKAGETLECYNMEDCAQVLEEMQDNRVALDDLIPFNILSMSDGRFMYKYTLESTYNTDPETFAIAMIGNFTNDHLPIKEQVDGIKSFISYHDKLNHFDKKYVVILKNSNQYLLNTFKNIPHFCANCKPT